MLPSIAECQSRATTAAARRHTIGPACCSAATTTTASALTCASSTPRPPPGSLVPRPPAESLLKRCETPSSTAPRASACIPSLQPHNDISTPARQALTRGISRSRVRTMGPLLGNAAMLGVGTPRAGEMSARRAEQASAPGAIVIENELPWVSQVLLVDGVEARPDPGGDFRGFRDVPAGVHIVGIKCGLGAVGSATFISKPGSAVVLRLVDEALVEDKDPEVCAAAWRALQASNKSGLVAFPAAPSAPPTSRTGATTQFRKSWNEGLGPSSCAGLTVPPSGFRGSASMTSIADEAAGEAAGADGLLQLQPTMHRYYQSRASLFDLVKLDDLFDDLARDPGSATLQGCYLDMLHHHLLRAANVVKDDLETSKGKTHLGKTLRRHVDMCGELCRIVAEDASAVAFKDELRKHKDSEVAFIGDQLEQAFRACQSAKSV
eukprot:m51a1_g8675 hypothetical protein (436) ;mRNA; f:150052-151628